MAGSLESDDHSSPTRELAGVALDSQCLSYLIDALEGVVRPTDTLAEQRLALVRT